LRGSVKIGKSDSVRLDFHYSQEKWQEIKDLIRQLNQIQEENQSKSFYASRALDAGKSKLRSLKMQKKEAALNYHEISEEIQEVLDNED